MFDHMSLSCVRGLKVLTHARSRNQAEVTFDDQLVGRMSIQLVWNSFVKTAKANAKEEKKAQLFEQAKSAGDEYHNASVLSSSPTPTVVTAVDSEASDPIVTPDNADGKVVTPSITSVSRNE